MKSQIISMVVFAVLLTASFLWVFNALRLKWGLNFTGTGCILMLLSSSVNANYFVFSLSLD